MPKTITFSDDEYYTLEDAVRTALDLAKSPVWGNPDGREVGRRKVLLDKLITTPFRLNEEI